MDVPVPGIAEAGDIVLRDPGVQEIVVARRYGPAFERILMAHRENLRLLSRPQLEVVK